VTGDRLALATRTMRARWPGTCPACRAPIHTGQQIAGHHHHRKDSTMTEGTEAWRKALAAMRPPRR
jgi:hypothetical protein